MKKYKNIILALVVLLAIALMGFFFLRQPPLSDGHKEVILDKHTCAYCYMHISDIRFASQIQMKKGATFFFDDHGCLLNYRKNKPISDLDIHSVYYYHLSESKWINENDVGFVVCKESPMGYNFGAVHLSDDVTNTKIPLTEINNYLRK